MPDGEQFLVDGAGFCPQRRSEVTPPVATGRRPCRDTSLFGRPVLCSASVVERGFNQATRIGCFRVLKDVLRHALFDNVSVLHDDHGVAKRLHNLQVMADEDVAQFMPLSEFTQELDQLGPIRDIPSVDFPDPLSPTMPSVSPARTDSDTSTRVRNSVFLISMAVRIHCVPEPVAKCIECEHGNDDHSDRSHHPGRCGK